MAFLNYIVDKFRENFFEFLKKNCRQRFLGGGFKILCGNRKFISRN